MLRKAIAKAGWIGVLVAACLAGPDLAHARGPVPDAQMPTVAVAQLPRQGREVHALIRKGGPFKYQKDGSVFGNRERLLPRAARGYYREYTVDTPGSRDRGARRIVCGGEEPKVPNVCYYTDDHYASFRRIVE